MKRANGGVAAQKAEDTPPQGAAVPVIAPRRRLAQGWGTKPKSVALSALTGKALKGNAKKLADTAAKMGGRGNADMFSTLFAKKRAKDDVALKQKVAALERDNTELAAFFAPVGSDAGDGGANDGDGEMAYTSVAEAAMLVADSDDGDDCDDDDDDLYFVDDDGAGAAVGSAAELDDADDGSVDGSVDVAVADSAADMPVPDDGGFIPDSQPNSPAKRRQSPQTRGHTTPPAPKAPPRAAAGPDLFTDQSPTALPSELNALVELQRAEDAVRGSPMKSSPANNPFAVKSGKRAKRSFPRPFADLLGASSPYAVGPLRGLSVLDITSASVKMEGVPLAASPRDIRPSPSTKAVRRQHTASNTKPVPKLELRPPTALTTVQRPIKELDWAPPSAHGTPKRHTGKGVLSEARPGGAKRARKRGATVVKAKSVAVSPVVAGTDSDEGEGEVQIRPLRHRF